MRDNLPKTGNQEVDRVINLLVNILKEELSEQQHRMESSLSDIQKRVEVLEKR